MQSQLSYYEIYETSKGQLRIIEIFTILQIILAEYWRTLYDDSIIYGLSVVMEAIAIGILLIMFYVEILLPKELCYASEKNKIVEWNKSLRYNFLVAFSVLLCLINFGLYIGGSVIILTHSIFYQTLRYNFPVVFSVLLCPINFGLYIGGLVPIFVGCFPTFIFFVLLIITVYTLLNLPSWY